MYKVKKIFGIVLILHFFLISTVQAETGMAFYRPTIESKATPSTIIDQASSDQAGFSFFKSKSSQAVSLTEDNSNINFSQINNQKFSVSPDQAVSGGSAKLDSEFEVSYGQDVLAQNSNINLSKVDSKIDLPWNVKKISSVYNLDIVPTADIIKQLTLTLSYAPGNTQFKQVYYFDLDKKVWLALPTTDYPHDLKVKALINKSTAMVAVFAKPGTLTIGKASWYKYKDGDFAASPDFPKGSILRVTNLANNKSVEVTINDWGPDRTKHPDRAIDLDKIAFAKIATTGDGVIKVSVSPIKLAADKNGRVLGVKAEGLNSEPKLSSKAVVIMNENDGQTWLEKNGDSVRPIASLTKVVAMSVYLSLQPDLTKEVNYKKADEAQNLRYCNTWENTKVNLKDGARMPAKDLFNSALVGSANNAVEALVRNSGISRDAFIALMNKTVVDWGASHTKFIEPTGLSNKNVSSAKDYATIVGQAMKNKDLASASVRPSYSFTASDKIKHNLKNTNKLIVEQAQLNLRAEQYPIISSKTGFLNEAGYCLMTRVKQGENNYTIVTLGAPTRADSFNDMADLINYLKFKIIWI